MNKEEAMEILKLYSKWNVGQKSVNYAMNGVRTTEDDVYDKRRELIKTAYDTLSTPDTERK